MIRIERGRLPAGAEAIAHRRNRTIVVHVSADLPARRRLAAVRAALRAAPAAGWRPSHSPVLLPALALCAGLRRAPEGRWTYRVLVTAATAAVMLIVATTLATVSVPHGRGNQPAALRPGAAPLTGPAPAASRPAAGHGPGTARQPGTRAGSSAARPGSAPGPAHKPGKAPAGSGPAPQASGTPAPVPSSNPSPQPSQAGSPSPSPSPTTQSGGSGNCVKVLGVTLCL